MHKSINDRQKKILKSVIEHHIEEKEFISSLVLVKTKELQKWSSATIRKDMVILEQEGYLKKEYFSSGKIPTKKGYKFYIQSLMDNYDGHEELKKKLIKIFSDRNKSIDQILDKCAYLISDFLNLPIILIRNNKKNEEYLRKIDLISINDKNYLLYLITSSGDIVKNLLVIENTDPKKNEDLITAVRLLNEKLFNCPINEISNKLNSVIDYLKEAVSQFEFIYENLISKIIFNKLINDSNEIHKVYNTKSIVARKDVNVYDLLTLLEKYSVFDPIGYNYLKTGKTLFNFEASEGLTVATTDIDNDSFTHRLSIIGPYRMNYSLIKYLFDFLNEKLSRT